jgi:hypothetical protein
MRALTMALALLTTAAGALPAATYQLNAEGTGDFPTIVAAIAAADPGDSILLAAGLYLGAGNTQLDYSGKDIVIAGAGPGATILDCQDSGVPVLRFENGETRAAVLRDLTLRNNYHVYEPPGIQIGGTSPLIANVIIDDFDTSGYYFHGSALQCGNGSPRIEDVVIRNCYGGAVLASGGAPEFEHVLVENCYGAEYRNGGGIAFSASAAILEEVTIRGCGAFNGMGGGVVCGGLPSPRFQACRFEYNTAATALGSPMGSGGGLACIAAAAPVLIDCVFLANTGRDGGGGIAAIEGASPVIEGGAFIENESAAGGSAVYLREASAVLRGATLSRGGLWYGIHEWNDPSAVLCLESALDIERCIVALNEVGAGLWADAASSPSVSCSDFYANPDGNYGGLLGDQTGLNGNISADPLFCDAAAGDYGLEAGSPCLPSGNGCGVQMGAFGEGCTGTAAEEATPAAYAFAAPQPNPFNPKTTLRFALPRAAAVELAIFDVNGRRVVRLVAGASLPAGQHAVDWEGRDEAGRALPSGVYFARFAAAGFTEERKLVLLR